LLFCVASGTEWESAGVTGATVTVLVVRGLIERDAEGRLVLTKQGRGVLDAAGYKAMADAIDLSLFKQ